eukprot:9737295-Alexandrium_andersonii.AAC.1
MPADAAALGHVSAEGGLRFVPAHPASVLRPRPEEVRLDLLRADLHLGGRPALAFAPERTGGREEELAVLRRVRRMPRHLTRQLGSPRRGASSTGTTRIVRCASAILIVVEPGQARPGARVLRDLPSREAESLGNSHGVRGVVNGRRGLACASHWGEAPQEQLRMVSRVERDDLHRAIHDAHAVCGRRPLEQGRRELG